FDIVTASHTYATGGNSDREHFFEPDTADQRMSPASVETCNVYNMLKLTRHLIAWSPTHTSYGDYYERALYNQILPSQDPEKAQYAYFMSLRPGGFHVYSTPHDSFWCCYGTGLENHTKYNDSIYFHDDANLYVNLFIPSVLTWKDKGLVLTQTTDFPKNGRVSLRFDAAPASAVALNVRCPGWAAGNVVFRRNGKVIAEGRPGSSSRLEAAWKTGDLLTFDIPMGLRWEPLLGGHAGYVAFFHGPTLLAGDFGPVPGHESRLYLRSQLDLQNEAGKPVPVLEAENLDQVMAAIEPVEGEDRAFTLTGVTRPRETLTLRPFNRMPYNYYNVYWHVLTPAQWAAHRQALAEEEARRKAFELRVVDQITFGEQQPETDHALTGENTRTGRFNQRTWRDASEGGWFEFRMKVVPGQPQVLMGSYWGDDVGRVFEILVDGKELAVQKLEHNAPGRFFDVEYPLPSELLAGKEHITVRLESKQRTLVGGLFGCAVLKAAAGPLTLRYDTPAGDWEKEALPIGNGRLGAMVFGGVEREHIQFNEDSLWIGDEQDTGAYQAFGEVFVELSEPAGSAVSRYRRELDIGRAVHTVTYTKDGVTYRREAFASHPAEVMVFRF
ncbi:MAG: glycoside hydrolase family 127 protein, partial [Verrucomicrobiae bacterium]|nr:glycoside hydrolase family 127 protein [Verrucomicrobiae bacterium]